MKDNPNVLEVAPTANGAWFGWVQNRQGKPDHNDFYVQRGTRARVKVNAVGTQGLGGAIVGRSVFYGQKRGDKPYRILRFDLRTGQRSPLPPKVNAHLRLYGECCGRLTASGPWLLYEGRGRGKFGATDTVLLYNRVTHKQRLLESFPRDVWNGYAGQVNGNYATYFGSQSPAGGGDELFRYDIKTKQSAKLPRPAPYAACYPDDLPICNGLVALGVPAVSSDGTTYYFFYQAPQSPANTPYISELWRQPIDGPAEVITTLQTNHVLGQAGTLFVKDRSDGSRAVFFSSDGDIYKVIDPPSSP